MKWQNDICNFQDLKLLTFIDRLRTLDCSWTGKIARESRWARRREKNQSISLFVWKESLSCGWDGNSNERLDKITVSSTIKKKEGNPFFVLPFSWQKQYHERRWGNFVTFQISQCEETFHYAASKAAERRAAEMKTERPIHSSAIGTWKEHKHDLTFTWNGPKMRPPYNATLKIHFYFNENTSEWQPWGNPPVAQRFTGNLL